MRFDKVFFFHKVFFPKLPPSPSIHTHYSCYLNWESNSTVCGPGGMAFGLKLCVYVPVGAIGRATGWGNKRRHFI